MCLLSQVEGLGEMNLLLVMVIIVAIAVLNITMHNQDQILIDNHTIINQSQYELETKWVDRGH